MAALVTRIFSDLHFRDGQSALHDLGSLAPLLAGADHLVLNGDTLDTLTPAAVPLLAEVRAFFPQQAPRVTFLSGNHDPFISEHGELLLNDGRVWITHGDVLFGDIAPWSGHRAKIRQRLSALARDTPLQEPDLIEHRLHRNRVVCARLPDPHNHFDRRRTTRALRVARVLFPPRRPLAMLNAWCTTPARARALADAQRPAARLVVVGHTHFPGVWRHTCGPVVVNTGSFCRPFGGQFVELRGDEVQVIRIDKINGRFQRGRVVAGFSLAP